ncbi:MAG TPA: hypothetical protein VNG53_07260 [Bacteroidia bacterium]|nr:hypothetical protein [Bacteroidia bacterium]
MKIKYFNRFLESENADNFDMANYKDKNKLLFMWGYKQADKSFNFHYIVDENTSYRLKAFPQFEYFSLTFPNEEILYCGFSALKSNSFYFNQFEEGLLYNWLLKTIMNIDYETLANIIDWSFLSSTEENKKGG